MITKRTGSEKGFTLIELMITVGIVSVALLFVLGAHTRMQKTSAESFERTIAMQHASTVAERMRDLAQTGLTNVTTTFPNGTVGSSNYTAVSTELLPSEAVTVSYANTAADPLDVTITVSWQALGVRTSSQNLRTYITQR